MQRRPINFALAALAASLLFLSAAPAWAHHSGAMFDMQHPITLTGVVTRVEWMNPHAYLYLNVTDEKGEVHEWAVEANSPNSLTACSSGHKRASIGRR
jgi:hypothetical protein